MSLIFRIRNALTIDRPSIALAIEWEKNGAVAWRRSRTPADMIALATYVDTGAATKLMIETIESENVDEDDLGPVFTILHTMKTEPKPSKTSIIRSRLYAATIYLEIHIADERTGRVSEFRRAFADDIRKVFACPTIQQLMIERWAASERDPARAVYLRVLATRLRHAMENS